MGQSRILSATGKFPEATAEYRAVLAICQKLVDDNPDVTILRRRLVLAHLDLGELLAMTGKPTEAEAECRAALAIC
jgi:hypothetical protein